MAKKQMTKANGYRPSSAADWLDHAPDFFSDAEKEALKARIAEQLRSQAQAAAAQLRQIESELERLGTTPVAPIVTPKVEAKPDSGWSVLRIVKHYLRTHSPSPVAPIIEYVTSIRPGEETTNVNSVLYKYSKPGRALKKTGEPGHYLYSLREEVNV